MDKKSIKIKDRPFLEDQWAKYCQQQKDNYLSILFGYNRPMKKLRRMLIPVLHSKETVQQALLLVQCETHQEILNALFRAERNNEKSDDGDTNHQAMKMLRRR